MYYLIAVDHHGGFQGCYKHFRSLEKAKAFLDADKTMVRSGLIAYSKPGYYIGPGDTQFHSCIVKSKVILLPAGKYDNYEVPPSGDYEADELKMDEFYSDCDRIFDFLETYVSTLTDWVDDPNESCGIYGTDSSDEQSGSDDDEENEVMEAVKKPAKKAKKKDTKARDTNDKTKIKAAKVTNAKKIPPMVTKSKLPKKKVPDVVTTIIPQTITNNNNQHKEEGKQYNTRSRVSCPHN